MGKIIHIVGIVAGYAACVAMIIVGVINQTPNVAGWKFILMGIVCAVCATVAIIDGARAFPTIGMWKVGGKFKGLTDTGFIIIFLLLLISTVIVFVAD